MKARRKWQSIIHVKKEKTISLELYTQQNYLSEIKRKSRHSQIKNRITESTFKHMYVMFKVPNGHSRGHAGRTARSTSLR